MPIEEREQLGADEDLELVDFRDADDPVGSPKVTHTSQNLLDHQEKDPQYRVFATPEQTFARSTQMNTPQLLQKAQQRNS